MKSLTKPTARPDASPTAGPPLRDAPEFSALSLGPRVKALRKLKGLTVDDLANAVGVNKAHVSRIERGLKMPSIATMARLASALGVTISHLVGETLDKAEIKVTRSADLREALETEEPALHSFVPLLHSHSVSAFEAFLVYPGQQQGLVEARHEGQEMLYILAGTVDVIFSDHTERLQAGDCIHFPGYLPHRIARVGRARAQALLVLSAG
jgi:transcriptional regulator with XRE-family HTH domain